MICVDKMMRLMVIFDDGVNARFDGGWCVVDIGVMGCGTNRY